MTANSFKLDFSSAASRQIKHLALKKQYRSKRQLHKLTIWRKFSLVSCIGSECSLHPINLEMAVLLISWRYLVCIHKLTLQRPRTYCCKKPKPFRLLIFFFFSIIWKRFVLWRHFFLLRIPVMHFRRVPISSGPVWPTVAKTTIFWLLSLTRKRFCKKTMRHCDATLE